MTINALICDSEERYIADIEKNLEKYCAEHKIICKYDSFKSGQEALKYTDAYNIAFLDTETHSIKGLEFAAELRQRNKNIIIFFISEYDSCPDDALNLSSFHCIINPFDCAGFYKSLDKALDLINQTVVAFYIKNANKVSRITSDEIMYIETLPHKTKIVTKKQVYYSKNQITYWDSMLNYSRFYRVHKSFILNMDYVDEYKRNEVRLTNGEIVPVAYRRQTEFRKDFYEYIKVIE